MRLSRHDSIPEVALPLIAALAEELSTRYGVSDIHALEKEDVMQPGSALVLASIDGRAVGCGIVRPFAERTAEVKRMFVAPDARGKGVARAVLAELEAIAREKGFTRVQLETGVRQPEAIRVYERGGYARCACWGKYATDTASVCFTKELA